MAPTAPSGKSPLQRIRFTIGQHERLITLIGAFIVFATFIIKDDFRDRYKDLVARIDTARTDYYNRRGLDILVTQVEYSSDMLHDLATELFKTETNIGVAFRNAKFAIYHRLGSIQYEMASLTEDLDSSERLNEELPPEQSQAASIDRIRSKVTALNTRASQAMRSVDYLGDSNRASDENSVGSVIDNLWLSKAEPIFEDSLPLFVDVKDLQKTLLNLADNVKKTRDREYTIVNWLSVVFFSLGWGLALISRILGVKGFGEPE